MPERTAESSSPTKSKSDQRQLDAFFSSPKTAKPLSAVILAAQPVFVQGSSKHLSTPEKSAFTSVQKAEIIDVDEFESDDSADTARVATFRAPATPSAKKPPVASEESIKPSSVCSRAKRREPAVCMAKSSVCCAILTHALVALSRTRSRIPIINILTNLLQSTIAYHPSPLLPAVYLLSNSLTPQFIALELSLGSSILSLSSAYLATYPHLMANRLPPRRLLQTEKSMGDEGCRLQMILGSITESPVSAAALGLTTSGRGLSIRFSRFIRTREDKGIEQASTPVFLVISGDVNRGDSAGEIDKEEEDSSEHMDFEGD
ncbi:hypothetical protein D9619_002010 [Psilocybe cf. subviscida]|uniref:Uncharacterized protein n=1 Tax=Psilocybe cf. subviscida TaxID=2480587 RepID=A0A8H5BGR1_9AGAR|nr:hypothetical protein D9619_002010 [Psilocybe cf. subviscida]